MYDALYGRQSVEKADSISVESQLEYCRAETHGGQYVEYVDRGFSGKDTNRPGFEKMMEDVRAGRVRRVIVYKLDRISRSIVDFANMMETFAAYGVDFISSTERFDTSTPIGRAMLNICIVFAQLERETIQKRVRDAYHARSRRGFYMGGRVPYGYRLKRTQIDGVRTAMYEEIPEEREQVRLIYAMYADPTNSLGDVVRYLRENAVTRLRGGSWNPSRLSEMLRNPVYVRADAAVYEFLKNQGAQMCDPPEDYAGANACYLYCGGAAKAGENPYFGRQVVLAPHEGIVPAEIWLACRRKCAESRRPGTRRVESSWLAGKLRCGKCGYSMSVRRSKSKWGRYFVCSRAGAAGGCEGAGCTVYADVMEEIVGEALCRRLREFGRIAGAAASASPSAAGNRLALRQAEEEIEGLVARVRSADAVLMRYINARVRALEQRRELLLERLAAEAGEGGGLIADPAALWPGLSFADRRAVADLLIETILVKDGKIEVLWRC